jgi:hypothetical protein
MTPELERSTLLWVILAAREHAEQGRLAEGYTRLLRGLRRAEESSGPDDPRGGKLVASYHEAIDEYIALYGVPMD